MRLLALHRPIGMHRRRTPCASEAFGNQIVSIASSLLNPDFHF